MKKQIIITIVGILLLVGLIMAVEYRDDEGLLVDGEIIDHGDWVGDEAGTRDKGISPIVYIVVGVLIIIIIVLIVYFVRKSSKKPETLQDNTQIPKKTKKTNTKNKIFNIQIK